MAVSSPESPSPAITTRQLIGLPARGGQGTNFDTRSMTAWYSGRVGLRCSIGMLAVRTSIGSRAGEQPPGIRGPLPPNSATANQKLHSPK